MHFTVIRTAIWWERGEGVRFSPRGAVVAVEDAAAGFLIIGGAGIPLPKERCPRGMAMEQFNVWRE